MKKGNADRQRERNRQADKGKCRQKKRPAVKNGNEGRQREEQAGKQTKAQTEETAGSKEGKCRQTERGADIEKNIDALRQKSTRNFLLAGKPVVTCRLF